MMIREYLKNNKLITDGSFGTYYADKYNTSDMPEQANTDERIRERVVEIHKEYIESGAKLIRTNTFASNTALLDDDFEVVKDNIAAAIALAKEAVGDNEVYIAADIGPIRDRANTDTTDEYFEIVKVFQQNGINIFNFETFSQLDSIIPVIERIKADDSEAFVMVQFSINQFGYTSMGLRASKLMTQASDIPQIDAIGFNCGIGPGHMEQNISVLSLPQDKYIMALPNAGYPQRVRNQIRYVNRPDYFVDKSIEMATEDGIDIVGGCCGTTPEFIALLSKRLDITQTQRQAMATQEPVMNVKPRDYAFYNRKKLVSKDDETASFSEKYVIAVELAPPLNADDKRVLEAANKLKGLGVDVLTFPDSPSGRTRVDSVLMADKVHRETGMCVMPHICCRDKNAIAMRSTFLGAHINDIHNLLIITGDPIPTMSRQTIKAVFNSDSVGLMNIAKDMNEESFVEGPMVYGGAINQGRKNLDVEIGRVRKKMEAGATFFMTQPVFTDEDIDRLRTIKQETGARILCGIMPLISRKNALFMKNEIAGVKVSDEIIDRYPPNATREEGEAVGVDIEKEIIEKTKDFVDGYYFSFPFNRVYMLESIM